MADNLGTVRTPGGGYVTKLVVRYGLNTLGRIYTEHSGMVCGTDSTADTRHLGISSVGLPTIPRVPVYTSTEGTLDLFYPAILLLHCTETEM